MALTYGYDPIQMQDGIKMFHDRSAAIQQHLADLHQFAVNHMVDWDDNAKVTYEEHKRAWDTAATNMNSILTEKAAPTLLNSLNTYELTEGVNQKRFMH